MRFAALSGTPLSHSMFPLPFTSSLPSPSRSKPGIQPWASILLNRLIRPRKGLVMWSTRGLSMYGPFQRSVVCGALSSRSGTAPPASSRPYLPMSARKLDPALRSTSTRISVLATRLRSARPATRGRRVAVRIERITATRTISIIVMPAR